MKRRDTYTRRNEGGEPATFNEQTHNFLKFAVQERMDVNTYVVSFHSTTPIFMVQKKIGIYFTNEETNNLDAFISGALSMLATLNALKKVKE